MIKDIIHDANIENKELYLVSIDQRKAFDSISHNYLFGLLDHLNINKFITNSIKRIYNQSFASLVVDQYIFLGNIFICGGIKQGCALSMNLYTMAIEELIVKIHSNPNIKGYKIPEMIPRMESNENAIEEEVKASIYADDTDGILRTKESIDPFFEEFNNWGEISGASMNEDKTKILAINSHHKDHKSINFTNELKILGIIFDKYGISKLNLKNCLKKIENTLNLWNNIRFNLIDKITVLRTFALSKLWFLLNFITIEEDEIVKIEKLSFNYIWNGKAELIARKILYCDFKEGGLNMVCIRAKIKMIFIRNLLYTKLNRNRPQYQFSIYWMKFFFRTFIDNFNIRPIGVDEERPSFYNLMLECAKTFSRIFETWSKIENEKKIKINEIRKNNKPLKLIDKSFLNNSNLLQSKFIYNLIVEQYLEKRNLKLPPNIENKEQINIFLDINRLNCSNIRLINYKLLRHGLPTNKKFKNRYDNICFMCKKILNESPEHIFVTCEISKEFYEFIRQDYLYKKSLRNSLDLLEFKRGVSENDYRALSCFVYCVWRMRNMSKHSEIDDNHPDNFKAIFNKWFITLTNI